MQTMFCCYYFKRSFSFQVFFDGLQLCLCTILRVPVSLLKCRSSFLLVQCRPFSHVASIDSNSASCFVLAHPSFGACPRSSQSRLCAYFPSGHSYAPSLIDSVSLFSLSLKKGAYHGRGFLHFPAFYKKSPSGVEEHEQLNPPKYRPASCHSVDAVV